MTTNLSRRIITTTTAIITVTSVVSYAAAQPSPTSYYDGNPTGITPAMIIIFASIVGTFFLMGCLSVYARSCVDYGGGDVSAATFHLPSLDGLEPAIVESFPSFVYSEVKGLKIGKGALECAVCLCEFEDTDTLRLLPKCCHVFHQDCIDTWLFANITCPVCRAVLVPLPGETNNFVLPVRELEDDTNPYHTAEDDIVINIQSPGLANSGQTPQQSVPPRSTSRKNRLFGKFKRSFTTGHVVIKPDVDYTRFTLRLPEEVRSNLVSRSLSQAKSSVVFSRVRSKRNGFRSATVGANKGRSLMNYERFEPEGRPDRWRFMRTLSNFSRTGSIQSPNRIGEDSEVQDMGRVSKNLSRSVKSSFQFGANDSIKEDVNVGERSFDRLRFDCNQV